MRTTEGAIEMEKIFRAERLRPYAMCSGSAAVPPAINANTAPFQRHIIFNPNAYFSDSFWQATGRDELRRSVLATSKAHRLPETVRSMFEDCMSEMASAL